MVLDSSAVLAILLNEPERYEFISTIAEASVLRISAASYVEAGIVMESRNGPAGLHQLILLLTRAGVRIDGVDTEQAEIALDAYRRFGKGRHPSGLNYGDCFSYALAAATGEPLLYRGDDFWVTDLESARRR
jgi:ribonuclease VapC